MPVGTRDRLKVCIAAKGINEGIVGDGCLVEILSAVGRRHKNLTCVRINADDLRLHEAAAARCHEFVIGQVPWRTAAGNFMKANPFDKLGLCVNQRQRDIVCAFADTSRRRQPGVAAAEDDYPVIGCKVHFLLLPVVKQRCSAR